MKKYKVLSPFIHGGEEVFEGSEISLTDNVAEVHKKHLELIPETPKEKLKEPPKKEDK